MTGAFEVFTYLSLPLVVLGTYLTYLYGQKKSGFGWQKYIALLFTPTAIMAVLAFVIGIKILYLYLVSALVGFGLEYFLGFTYEKVFHRKLWTYDATAYSIGEHTSLLTLPMWGLAGVVFWSLGKILGL